MVVWFGLVCFSLGFGFLPLIPKILSQGPSRWHTGYPIAAYVDILGSYYLCLETDRPYFDQCCLNHMSG